MFHLSHLNDHWKETDPVGAQWVSVGPRSTGHVTCIFVSLKWRSAAFASCSSFCCSNFWERVELKQTAKSLSIFAKIEAETPDIPVYETVDQLRDSINKNVIFKEFNLTVAGIQIAAHFVSKNVLAVFGFSISVYDVKS